MSRLPRRRDIEDVAVASAEWRLRFYCWRKVLMLSVATAAAADAVLAILEGRPPHTMDVVTSALKER